MSTDTGLEQGWQVAERFGPFVFVRQVSYDATYGCAFKIPHLSLASATTTVPPEVGHEWVDTVLDTLVRDETGGRHELAQPWNSTDRRVLTVSDAIVYDLLVQSEAQIAFGERTETLLEKGNRTETAATIAAILREPVLGNRKNADSATEAEVFRGVAAAGASGGPLVFLLPGFPFKEQNPFRSDLPSSVPDLADIGMLIHLHSLALAMNQAFRHDVTWLIVSDGTVYEEMFGAPVGSGRAYLAALRDWRSRLNLAGSLHFIDLQEIVARYENECPTTGCPSFETTRRAIETVLRNSLERDESPHADRISKNLSELARGMLWNSGWPAQISRYGLETLWRVHVAACDPQKLSADCHPAAQELWPKAIDTAVKYAAFNLASRSVQLLQQFMPSAVRATSHPKAGQVAIPRDGGVAPWNGLGVYELRANVATVRSIPLCQIPAHIDCRFRLSTGSALFGFADQDALRRYL